MKLMSLVRLDILPWFFFCCKRTVVIFPALLGTLKRMRRSRGPSGSGELSRKGRHGHVGMLRFDLLIHPWVLLNVFIGPHVGAAPRRRNDVVAHFEMIEHADRGEISLSSQIPRVQ